MESLNNLSDVPNDDATRKTLSTLSLRQLESRVTQTLDDLQNAQNDLATYNSQLVSLQTQPERVQNAMFNASQQLQQIRNRLNGTSVGDETLRPTQQVLLQAQQALLNAQIEQQRKSLEGNTILQDTLQKQRDYVTALEQPAGASATAAAGGREQQTADPDRENRPRRQLPPTKRRVFRPTRWSSRSWILTISSARS